MTIHQLGQAITWAISVLDEDGQPANVGGGVTCTAILPDGTEQSCAVANPSVGEYEATLSETTQVGRHRPLWEGTGANSGGLPDGTDVADVFPADPRMIVGLADARAALNLPAAIRVNDSELLGLIAAATVVVEDLIGPVLPAARVERRSGSYRMGIPLWAKAESITTVTEDGVTLASTDWCLDEAGILWRGSSPGAGAWSGNGAQNVVVTYAVGSAIIPPNVLAGAAELVKFWYSTSQQGARPQLQPDAPAYPMVAGFAVPNSVADKLRASDNRMPGIA